MKYAVPLIISAGSISIMNFTDRMFLMWYSPTAMTASMQGGMLFWSLVSLPMAAAGYTNAFVSQYYGSGNNQRIGPVVWQGIGLGLALMPFFLLLEPFCHYIYAFFGHDQDLITLEKSYFRIATWGSGAVIASEAAASFFYGRGKMHVVMNVNIFFLFVNVVLDYCWIFGYAGFPRWGLEGAAIATTLAQWGRLIMLVALMFWADAEEHRFRVRSGIRFDFPLLGRLLYFGGASGIQVFADTASFTLFIMLIGGLGLAASNATTIAFTMNSFTFLPLVGTGIAVTTMVGNQLGHNRADLAARATITAIVIGLAYSLVFGLAFLIFPHTLLKGFAAFTNQEEFSQIETITTHLLQFVALYILLDGVTIILASAIKGAGDTWFVFKITVLLAPLSPLLGWVGIHFLGFGLYWCWIVLTTVVWVFGVVFAWRFFEGKWKKMRVIEKELLVPDGE